MAGRSGLVMIKVMGYPSTATAWTLALSGNWDAYLNLVKLEMNTIEYSAQVHLVAAGAGPGIPVSVRNMVTDLNCLKTVPRRRGRARLDRSGKSTSPELVVDNGVPVLRIINCSTHATSAHRSTTP